jgi:hypothetical protein
LAVSSPFTNLALRASGNLIQLSFQSVLIHLASSC